MASASYSKRHQKQPKAYIIGGHGNEQDDETFIVPPGCIIVVKAYAGSTTKAYGFLEKGLCSLTPTILKHPTVYYADLERVLGSLAVYQPGDVCPQFYYNLLQCYQMSNEFWHTCNSFGSGVMDVDNIYADKEFLECTRNVTPSNRDIKNSSAFMELSHSDVLDHESIYDSVYPYLSRLYQHSVFPTPEEIESIVHDAIDENIDSLHQMLDYIQDKVHITQEELCYELPGVYYHVVCRATPEGISKFHIRNEMRHMSFNDTYLSSKPAIQHLLGKHVSEAELHRKPYIKSMYERKKGPSRATLRRRLLRKRQKQRMRNKTKKNHN